MSMAARFVAIAPVQLAEVVAAPETVGSVFALDAAAPLESPTMARERLLFQAPRLVADMLGRMPPDVRRRLQRRLGLDENSRPGPNTDRRLLLQLAEREAARQRQKPAPGSAGNSLSLDKAWHGLHYLLCGAKEPAPGPLGQAVFGGAPLGCDLGYGPARSFAATEVTQIAAALKARGLSAQLRGRFDRDAMTRLGIYPGTWEPDDRTWLIDAYRSLRDFYAAAGRARLAVVTRIE